MLGIALSLVSSLSWGVADFMGGLQSRRMHVLGVVLISQTVGLLLALALLPALADRGLSDPQMATAAAAGAAGAVGLIGFYTAMSMGEMSVVAPIAAMGVAVPVVVGLLRGDQPRGLQLAGVAVAVLSILLVSREEGGERRGAVHLPIALAGIAALGFGTFLALIGTTAHADAAWTVALVRVGGVAVLALALLATRPSLQVPRSALPVLALVGVFDVGANALYAVATTKGLLPVIAVGGSLYPAVTILLAYVVLGERLATVQRIGVMMALVGIAMIAAGT